MALIYKITNLINNKIYIGKTNGSRKNYFGSGTILRLSIKKYGKNNFKIETITEGNFNKELLNSLEIHYIQLYNSTNKNVGYNIEKGGDIKRCYLNEDKELKSLLNGGLKSKYKYTHNKETRKKMSLSKIGKKLSKEHISNMMKSIRLTLDNREYKFKERVNSRVNIICENIITNEFIYIKGIIEASKLLNIKRTAIVNGLSGLTRIVNKQYKFSYDVNT